MIKRRGIVVDTHPEDNSVDLVLSDGRRLVGVQVLSGSASSRTGKIDLPEVPPRQDKWDITQLTGQDIIAIVDWVDGDMPLVVGFLYPQISQMTFADKRLKFERHQSDWISTMDGDGNFQMAHPNGAYIRVGESTEFVDYSGQNFDENLAVDRNTDKQVSIHIQQAGGVMHLTIAPDGHVSLETDSTVFVKATQVDFDTPLITTTGRIVAAGDVIGQNVSLATHVHPGVIFGPMSTMPPTPTSGGETGGGTGGDPGGDMGGGDTGPPLPGP